MRMKHLRVKQVATSFAFFLLGQTAFAGEETCTRIKKNHELPRLEAKPLLDGKLDDPVWRQALKIELDYETNPGENTKPPVTTEVYIYEDGETLFIGFNALDPKPEKIRDYLTDRDKIWDSDFVGIKFDPFGEKRKAFQFFTNAIGVQADATQEDFRGDNANWDAIWDSAGALNENGYQVEMAIPFKALRFPQKAGKQTWGFELLRFYPRQFRHRIANSPVNRNISCRVCQFDNLVGFADLKPSQNLQLVPTLVLGKSESRDDAFEPWDESDTTEVGLDFRWGITQDIVLNATLNPDFSQVEADAAQLDVNNPFSIFVPEKRPFFLDGADYFQTNKRLVNTRNAAAPDYGIKVTGQTNGHSFGVLAVDDTQTSFLVPGRLASSIYTDEDLESKNAVLRYSYDLGNKNNVGVIYTDRSATDYRNQVAALDGKYWFDQYHSVSFQYMRSETENPQAVVDEYADEDELLVAPNMSGDAYTMRLRHDSRNWEGFILYEKFDPEFRADFGFIGRVNLEKTVAGGGYTWYPDSGNSIWSKIFFGGDWDQTFDDTGLELEEESEIRLRIDGKLNSEIRSGYGVRERFWDNQTFDEDFVYLNSKIEPVSGLKLFLGLKTGDSVDFANTRLGEDFRITPEISWQFHNNWLASFDYNHLDFDVDAGELFTARLSNFRLTYQISIRSFLRVTAQRTDISRNLDNYLEPDDYDATSKDLSAQLLYSYKINPQTLFFAGYSDSGYQDDDVQDIEKIGRSVFMKFSYAWQL